MVREFDSEPSKWERMGMALKSPWDYMWKRPDPVELGPDIDLREWINPDLEDQGEQDGCEY